MQTRCSGLSVAVVSLLLLEALVGCGKPKERSGEARNPSDTGSGNPLTAPVDYLGAVNAAHKRSARVVDLAPVQQAVKAFQAGEDRLPSRLEELVSEGYLPRLPEMPPGVRFEYNPQTGQVRLGAVASGAPPGTVRW